ncbi:MAG: hypothetical protein VYE22_01170 [Myxococcota bacterium]|nr:hypothetical protein [Myxococcota bacterium]
MRNWNRLGFVLALGLAGCTMEAGDTSAPLIADGDAGVCESSWTTRLRVTTGARATVGRVNYEMIGDVLYASIIMAPDMTIGDTYLGIGTHGAAPTWVVANPEPWVTGWRSEMRIRQRVPRDTCGTSVKIQLQANVRRRDGSGRRLASAYGPQDRGRWGWADFRPWCCDDVCDPSIRRCDVD